jgi:hypothetical protein
MSISTDGSQCRNKHNFDLFLFNSLISFIGGQFNIGVDIEPEVEYLMLSKANSTMINFER